MEEEQFMVDEVDVGQSHKSQPDTSDVPLVVYGIEDNPPWYICLILGLQHYLMMFAPTLAIPIILMPMMCVGDNHLATNEVLSTLIFVSGICTLLQTTFGTRLPIVQGGSWSYLLPAISILGLPEFQCPADDSSGGNSTSGLNETMNGTMADPDIWKIRMREIQGAIIASATFQVVIGATGLTGYIINAIGPLTIAPTIALIGISLFQYAADYCASQWYIALLTMFLITLFSQYLKNVRIPIMPCGRILQGKRAGGTSSKLGGFPFFELFSVILAIVVVWIICAIFTAADVFPADENKWGYLARTDIRTNVLYDSAWFKFPYPFQWGLPTFSAGGVFGMLAGVLAGLVESIGDYFACARLSGVPPPPVHALNRGIFAEGIGCVLSGMWGSSNGSTSYSHNIGSIGLTKVASRRVVQYSAMFMLLFGMVHKFGALFVTIPDPIMGGVFMVMFGLVVSVGFSNLQFVNLNSSRNIYILGFSFFFGLSLPFWISTHSDAIQTGSTPIDRILTVLLSTSMFVGGILGFILDNTIPGSPEERGLSGWREEEKENSIDDPRLRCYNLPLGMKFIRQMSWTSYIPICPTYVPSKLNCCKTRKNIALEPDSPKEVNRL